MNRLYVSVAGVILVVGAILLNQAKYGPSAQAGSPGDSNPCSGCDMHGAGADHSAAAATDSAAYLGKLDADGRASGSSLMAAYKAENLYRCPMHPEIISDRPDASCPICGMNLTKLTPEEVTKLRESNLRGCVMHPVVVAGDSDIQTCTVCGMNLVDADKVHTGMKMEH